MVRVFYQEINEKIEGEGSKLHKEGEGLLGGHNDEDKSKKGNGGTGESGKSPSSPSSSSSSTSTSSLVHHSHKVKNTVKNPFLKLDVKFQLPMFDGEVNAEKLDNWIRQLEVYLRIQNFHDDETKI